MITKETSYEKMEVFPDGKIRVTENTKFIEDGKVLADMSTGRRMIKPGEDVEKEVPDVKKVALSIHTQEKIDQYNQDNPQEVENAK